MKLKRLGGVAAVGTMVWVLSHAEAVAPGQTAASLTSGRNLIEDTGGEVGALGRAGAGGAGRVAGSVGSGLEAGGNAATGAPQFSAGGG